MKDKFKEFLKDNMFWPLSNWNFFELEHYRVLKNEKQKKRDFKIINANVGDKNGLYVYKKLEEILYLGKGQPLANRIKGHYRASYKEVPGDTKFNTWHKFWSSHLGKMKIYWKEVEDRDVRMIIEQMLHYFLRPKFDSWRRKFESDALRYLTSKKSKN